MTWALREMKIAIPKGKRERWLKDDELKILLPGLERLTDSKARDVYMLVLASGCRPGEAAGVLAEEISTVNGEGVWKIRYKVEREGDLGRTRAGTTAGRPTVASLPRQALKPVRRKLAGSERCALHLSAPPDT
jgi:integrase